LVPGRFDTGIFTSARPEGKNKNEIKKSPASGAVDFLFLIVIIVMKPGAQERT
jgi:hypothetical protein